MDINTSVGLEKLDWCKEVILFPNPVKNELWLRLSESERTNVRIFNLLGQELAFKDVKGERVKIDVSALVPGIFFVDVNSGNTIIRKRVIKE